MLIAIRTTQVSGHFSSVISTFSQYSTALNRNKTEFTASSIDILSKVQTAPSFQTVVEFIYYFYSSVRSFGFYFCFIIIRDRVAILFCGNKKATPSLLEISKSHRCFLSELFALAHEYFARTLHHFISQLRIPRYFACEKCEMSPFVYHYHIEERRTKKNKPLPETIVNWGRNLLVDQSKPFSKLTTYIRRSKNRKKLLVALLQSSLEKKKTK